MPEPEREIHCVQEGTSVAKLLDSMSKISKDIQNVTQDLSTMVSGSQGSIKQIIANVEKASASLNEAVETGSDKLGAVLDNAQAFTGTLAKVASEDQERYHAIARNIEMASGRLDQVLRSVQQLFGPQDGDVTKSITDVRESLARLNRSMEQVEKVATNIGQGKGVAGKLLADERLGEKLSGTIENVGNFVERLSKTQLNVNLRSEWLLNHGAGKFYASFYILPRPDKYFLFQVVGDPRGLNTQSAQTITSQTPAGTATTTTTTTNVNVSSVEFSAEFAKRLGPAAFRVGLIESSGGAGADLYLLHDSLKISMDIFQFGRPPTGSGAPRAKLWADYSIYKYLYATIGMDDFLNSWRAGHYPGGPKFSFGNDVLIGGGVAFTDDDLKTLFGLAGSALSGIGR